MITYCITKSNHFKFFDWLVLKLQDTETETLKPHYIHVYKVFGFKFWLVYKIIKLSITRLFLFSLLPVYAGCAK